MIKGFKLIVTIIITTELVLSKCPSEDLLRPCSCDDKYNSIVCYENVDLKQLFTNVSINWNEKHFDEAWLTHTNQDRLEANTFQDITIDHIEFAICHFKTIDQDAFKGTDQVTKQLWFWDVTTDSHDDAIFDQISKFKNLEFFKVIYKTYIVNIPNDAFKNEQDQLKEVHFESSDIKEIGSHAFAKLKNLKRLSIINTSIEYIPEEVFAFDEPSDETLIIDMSKNYRLTGSSFSLGSLSAINRPTSLILWFGDLRVMEEKIFRPFLDQHEDNVLDITYNGIDCDDRRNDWLKSIPFKKFPSLPCKIYKTSSVSPVYSSTQTTSSTPLSTTEHNPGDEASSLQSSILTCLFLVFQLILNYKEY